MAQSGLLMAQIGLGGGLTKEAEAERDAVAKGSFDFCGWSRKSLSDLEDYLTSRPINGYAVRSSLKKTQYVHTAKSGIRQEDNSYYDKSLKERSQVEHNKRVQAEQAKAARQAEHEAWLERKEAEREEAEQRAREARQREELEREMRRKQYEAKYLQEYLERTVDIKNKLAYRSGEGRQLMLEYRHPASIPIQSSYTPSNPMANRPGFNELAEKRYITPEHTSFLDKKFTQKTSMDSAFANTSTPVMLSDVMVRDMVSQCDGLAEAFVKNPTDIDALFRQKFKDLSKYDIAEIMNKMPGDRTPDELQALKAYDVFRAQLSEKMAKEIDIAIENSPEKKEMDAAILALDCYGDDKEGWIHKTSYRKVEMEDLPEEWKALKKKLDICNQNGEIGSTGFHAEMYYNKITGDYEIAFRGTHDLKSTYQDIDIAEAIFKGEGKVMQYDLTKIIADEINKLPDDLKSKLSVTGHSLGGGQASIIGLVTGVDTKTFNAATIPDAYLKKWGLEKKVKNGDVQNIMAYHNSADILTNSQQKIGSEAIGIKKNLGDIAPSAEMKTGLKAAAKVKVGKTVAKKFPKTTAAAATVVALTFPDKVVEKTKLALRAGEVVAAGGPEASSIAKDALNNPYKTGYQGEAHRMPHMTVFLYESNAEKMKSEWDRQRYCKQQLLAKGHYDDPITQDHILIKKDESFASFGR